MVALEYAHVLALMDACMRIYEVGLVMADAAISDCFQKKIYTGDIY